MRYNMIDVGEAISKHDPHACDGRMCRLTFSKILCNLQEMMLELIDEQARNDDGTIVDEGLVGVLKREREKAIWECVELLARQHEYYLYKEPLEYEGDPLYAELAEIPTMEEWKDRQKNKNDYFAKEHAKNLWNAVRKKEARRVAFEKAEKKRAEEYQKKWEQEHPEEAKRAREEEEKLIKEYEQIRNKKAEHDKNLDSGKSSEEV